MFWSKNRIYLDCAAGASGNPSSPHREGRLAKKMLENARTNIARLIDVQSDDVIFTSGATEANAIAILGTVKQGDHALYLPSAHASIIENMRLLKERGVDVEAVPIKNMRVDCKKLKELLRPQTKLIAMDAVCGETGVIWNTKEVKQTIGPDVLLHVDASQAPLTEKITRAHFCADMLTLDGSKVGVRAVGALIAHRTVQIESIYKGGGQERGLRPGSESPELAKAFAAALRAAVDSRESFCISAKRMRDELKKTITDTISNICINESDNQAPNILNLSLVGRDTDYLVALLDEAGFAISTRSACETDSNDGSRAVFALTGDHDRSLATLRVSWNQSIRSGELASFAKELARDVAFIDSERQR